MSELRPAPSFVGNALAVTERNLLVWRRGALASAVGYVGEPLLYLVALGFGLGRVVPTLGGMSYAEFIAPGLVVSTAMYTATFEGTFGAYTRLAVEHAYDAILATPISLPELVAGEILFGGIKSCFGGTIVLLVATAFGLVPSFTAVAVVPIAFLTGLLFSAMALVATGLSRGYDVFNYYFTLVIAPMYLFGGVFFPLEEMPAWVRTGALAVPLTHVVRLSRALVRGTLSMTLAVHVVAVLVFLVIAAFLAVRVLRRRIIR
jgi:lipooligosaccharide transport system permease protein